jgi:glucokinase
VIEKFLRDTASTLGLAESDIQPVACCLAVAGPVRANIATITNVNWVLDGAEMSRQLHIPDVLIINDFVGIGYGLLALTRADIVPINDVPMADDAPKACIGAGTGLGEVYLTAGHMIHSSDQVPSDHSSSEYNVWASEGGHADFAPRDQLEFGLLEYFKKNERVTRVSVERIVSGLGIPKIYEYFTTLYPEEVKPEVTALLRTKDPGAVIGEYASNGQCDLCRKTIELFVKCYGAETGNFALKFLPFGGLFIGGGIAPKLQSFLLKNNLFYEHFVKKGRMQTVLEKIPVFLIRHEAVGLLGAKVVCRRLLRKQGFLPGRGELPTFTEATPRALPEDALRQFAFPNVGDTGEDFETEVTLRPDGSQIPEKVVIRRRHSSAIMSGEGGSGSINALGSSSPVSSSPIRGGRGLAQGDVQQIAAAVSSALKRDAFSAGMIGGLLGGVAAVATLIAVKILKRNNFH